MPAFARVVAFACGLTGCALLIPERPPPPPPLPKDCPPLVSEAKDDGFISASHQKHVGQIVWAKRPIERGHDDEALFETTFGPRDFIYGRVYLAKPLGKVCVKGATIDGRYDARAIYRLGIAFDGDNAHPAAVSNLLLQADPAQAQQETSFELAPLPTDVDAYQRTLAELWVRATRKLAPGKHRVRVRLWAADGELSGPNAGYQAGKMLQSVAPLASGEFTYVLGEHETPRDWPIPPPAMRDAELERSMLDLTRNEGWEGTPLRVVIRGKEWKDILENQTVVRRELPAAIGVRTPGGTCGWLEAWFARGTAGANAGRLYLRFSAPMSDMHLIPCEEVDGPRLPTYEEVIAKGKPAIVPAATVLGDLDCPEPSNEPDDGFISETHRKFAGRIVWSKKPILRGQEDESAFTGSFTSDDPIYGRVYLTKPLGKTCVKKDGRGSFDSVGAVHSVIYIDGVAATVTGEDDGVMGIPPGLVMTLTSYNLVPTAPDVAKYGTVEARRWAHVAQGLAPGAHSIRYEVWAVQNPGNAYQADSARSAAPVAVGEFQYFVK